MCTHHYEDAEFVCFTAEVMVWYRRNSSTVATEDCRTQRTAQQDTSEDISLDVNENVHYSRKDQGNWREWKRDY